MRSTLQILVVAMSCAVAQLNCSVEIALDLDVQTEAGFEGDAPVTTTEDADVSDRPLDLDTSVEADTSLDAGADLDASESVDADRDVDAPESVDSSSSVDAVVTADANDLLDAVPDGGVDGSIGTGPWPGANEVTTVDVANTFGTNLSGLAYQPASSEPAVMWGVRNGPSTLFSLTFDGANWVPVGANDWNKGKSLRFPDGSGDPDSEGVTKAEWDSSAVYVSTERDNLAGGKSRLSVLRFDADAAGTTLTATNEWNLTADLPPVGANLGLEALTWIPDSFLVSGQFIDESTGQPYDPQGYPDHGTGVFIVGLEANGMLYAYVLDHATGGYHRIATFASGHVAVMDVQFDRDVGYLWSVCDDTCGNKTGVLTLDTTTASPTLGKFRVVRIFDRPSTLPNVNNEGIAIAPESECDAGMKAFFWTDDNQTGGHALRHDLIPCGRFLGNP
jgi:hypothetical protein